ncbi:MAG: GNAT family N-acetyltransferase [Flavobacteriales bacterium]|nr:GNAT family N-acetyltransferase [Flavobacteriales bacterium]
MNNPDTIRKATGEDIPFLVEAVVSAEKSGTPRFGLANTFGLSEAEMRGALTSMFKEEVDHCEISVSSFLIAEWGGVPAAAVAGWVEGADGEVPSALLKANLLGYTLPGSSMLELARRASAIEGVRIERMRGALQIEYVHVDERFRGRRLGIRLIEAHLVAILGSVPPVTRAQVQAFADNRAAISLYEKLGFAVVGTCTSDHPDTSSLLPHHSKVLMERPLP